MRFSTFVLTVAFSLDMQCDSQQVLVMECIHYYCLLAVFTCSEVNMGNMCSDIFTLTSGIVVIYSRHRD